MEELFLGGAMGAGSIERAFSRVSAPSKERAREMWSVVWDARTVAGVGMYSVVSFFGCLLINKNKR